MKYKIKFHGDNTKIKNLVAQFIYMKTLQPENFQIYGIDYITQNSTRT